MSRIEKVARNIKYGYLGTLLTIILRFVSRTVFIYTIGATKLGVNGLFTNVLSVLSLAELGFGTAMNYSLYKPVAENNYEKIKSLMQLFKMAYRWISLVITVIGLSLVPFLHYIIKDSKDIGNNELTLYYLLFLFNTVITYFVSYKYSLINAEQKNYIEMGIRTITMIVVTIFQIIVMIVFHNFLIYLLTATVIELVQKIIVNIYLNRRYPFLSDKNIRKLSKEETDPIKKNIKALIYHKFGEISVHQTDNILISTFINITTVGVISNYILLISTVSSLINIMLDAITSSFGNLIATENIEKQFRVFKVYRFMGFWFYGFASIAILILISPFIELWLGPSMVVESIVVYLIITDYYFKGHRIIINNFKTAAGVFNADKYISIIQAIVNLVVSVLMVRLIGLPGIYIGTILQGMVSTLTKPKIVYNSVFKKSSIEYYKDSILYLGLLICILFFMEIIKSFILKDLTVINFVIMLIIVAVVPNTIFILFFRKREEYKYIYALITSKIKSQKL